jgi:hypothetical protein
LTKKAPYKPDAGNRHVRFDERRWETERWRYSPSYRRPSSTLPILGASDAAADAGVAEAHSGAHPAAPSLAATQTAPAVSADDLIEPLAFILSKVVKHLTIGNPLADELIGICRTGRVALIAPFPPIDIKVVVAGRLVRDGVTPVRS